MYMKNIAGNYIFGLINVLIGRIIKNVVNYMKINVDYHFTTVYVECNYLNYSAAESNFLH